MKKNFKQQLQNVNDKAYLHLNKLINKKGEISKFSPDKVLKIKDDNFMFNLDGKRYLVEVAKEYLIDNEGYHYNHYVLDRFDYMDIIDHLTEIYENN